MHVVDQHSILLPFRRLYKTELYIKKYCKLQSSCSGSLFNERRDIYSRISLKGYVFHVFTCLPFHNTNGNTFVTREHLVGEKTHQKKIHVVTPASRSHTNSL